MCNATNYVDNVSDIIFERLHNELNLIIALSDYKKKTRKNSQKSFLSRTTFNQFRYSGTLNPGQQIAIPFGAATLRFVTNEQTTYKGFRFTWEAVPRSSKQ